MKKRLSFLTYDPWVVTVIGGLIVMALGGAFSQFFVEEEASGTESAPFLLASDTTHSVEIDKRHRLERDMFIAFFCRHSESQLHNNMTDAVVWRAEFQLPNLDTNDSTITLPNLPNNGVPNTITLPSFSFCELGAVVTSESLEQTSMPIDFDKPNRTIGCPTISILLTRPYEYDGKVEFLYTIHDEHC